LLLNGAEDVIVGVAVGGAKEVAEEDGTTVRPRMRFTIS